MAYTAAAGYSSARHLPTSEAIPTVTALRQSSERRDEAYRSAVLVPPARLPMLLSNTVVARRASHFAATPVARWQSRRIEQTDQRASVTDLQSSPYKIQSGHAAALPATSHR